MIRSDRTGPLLLWALCACAGSSPHDDSPSRGAQLRQPAVYAADQRRDVYEAPDAGWEQLARESIAAVLSNESFNTRVDFCSDAGMVHHGTTAGAALSLCATEPFFDQPVISNCSSTLIDDDVVVTAHHCLAACTGTMFVFGLFHTSAGHLNAVSRHDVYSCQSVLVDNASDDVVIVKLDRPVAAPYRPARITTLSPVIGQAVGVVGFPMGVPMKISADCTVREILGGTYRHNCDSNAGNSGSGTFNANRELFAVMSTGPGDFKPSDEGCRVAVRYDDEGRLPGLPTAPQLPASNELGSTVAALCATHWPGRLCGSAPQCGDQRCSGTETPQSCAADCPLPFCGDGVCNVDEGAACVSDCGARLITLCPSLDAGSADDGGQDAGDAVDAGSAPDAGPADGGLPPCQGGGACLPSPRVCSVTPSLAPAWALLAAASLLRGARARRRARD